jgi:hypothetical protein
MKRNVVLEAQILKAVEVLGEATEPEIITEIKEQFAIEINDYEFMRNLRRWLAKKCITVSKIKGENAYKLRDVPPFFKSLQTYQLKGITAQDAEVTIEKLEQHYQAINAQVSKGPAYGGYSFLECQFETLDLVAGGDGGVEDRKLLFPRKEGKPYIRGNWISGYLRDNSRLVEVNGTFLREYASVSDSQPLEVETELVSNVKVKEGMCTYETIPAGTQFTVRMRVPLRGSKIKSIKDFENFLHMLEDTPLRGLGAYSHYFGGRIKLVNMKEIA